MEQHQDYHTRFQKFRTPPYHAPHIHRIVLLSDLHTDYPANQEWLYNLCTSTEDIANLHNEDDSTIINDAVSVDDDAPSEKATMIIIAGDVSHNLDILQWTFQTLKKRYAEVIYTPGNHELWLDKPRIHKKVATTLDADDNNHECSSRCKSSGKGDGCTNSVEKLEKILDLCLEEDVRIGPVLVGGADDYQFNNNKEASNKHNNTNGKRNNTSSSLWVIPFLSWHHTSFDTEPSIECWGGIPSARKVVADYRRTSWPLGLSALDDSAAKFVDGLNDVILDLDSVKMDDGATTLLTFSHFLPRIELLPEKRYLSLPTLHSCVGSSFLEERIRQLKRKCDTNSNINTNGRTAAATAASADKQEHLHAFGHSHLAWDATIDGIRYVHVPLAYPREWEQRRRSLEIGTMRGEESHGRFPVCIWEKTCDRGESTFDADNSSSSSGFPSQWLGGWWSKYYTVMPRQPHRNRVLAPWAAKRFRQLPGGEIENFNHVEVEERYRLQCPTPSLKNWAAGTGNWYETKGSRRST